MNRKSMIPMLLALATVPIHQAAAQSREQLLEENRNLRAQLDARAQGCGPDAPRPSPQYQDGQVSATIESLRVGRARNPDSRVVVTTNVALRNTGNTPMALNYELKSFAMTDDRGYQYELRTEGFDVKESVKGIPVATRLKADPTAVLEPGESRTVTFIASRDMRPGQTPGAAFDLNATFGQYIDEGQGRIRKGRQHPVSFIGVAAGDTASPTSETGTKKASEVVGRLLDGLLK